MAQMLINGESVDSQTKNSYPVYNPASGEIVDTAPKGDARDVDAAVDAAERAFPKWWATPAAKRGEIVGAGAHKILENEDELARLLTSEQGKPLREARVADIENSKLRWQILSFALQLRTELPRSIAND